MRNRALRSAVRGGLSIGYPRVDRHFALADARGGHTRDSATAPCGDGAKAPRVYDWAAIRLPAVAEYDYRGEALIRARWAPARRSLSRPDEIARYLAYAPPETTVNELERIAGMRWAIEVCQPQCTHERQSALGVPSAGGVCQ
jgi:hypothetical protein